MEVDIFSTKKKYGVIYADPPWRYGDRNCNGACEKHYNTMTLQEIKNLPVGGGGGKRLRPFSVDYIPHVAGSPGSY